MILWNRNALNLNHFVYISFAIIFQLSSMLITHEILFASKKEDFDEKCSSIDNFVSIVTALGSSQQFSSLCVQHILLCRDIWSLNALHCFNSTKSLLNSENMFFFLSQGGKHWYMYHSSISKNRYCLVSPDHDS